MRARPLPLSVASVLLALLSLANLLSPAMPSEGVPAFVIYLGVVLGVLGLIGAAGLWMLKRWALWLTIVVCVCAQHPLGGSGAGLRADPHAASACNGRGCGLRFSYLVGGGAELAPSVHLTNFREHLNPDVGG
jgi:hypothetical protein